MNDLNAIPWSVIDGVEEVDEQVFMWEHLFKDYFLRYRRPTSFESAEEAFFGQFMKGCNSFLFSLTLIL